MLAGQRTMGGAAANKLREPTRILSEELQKPTLKLMDKIHAKLATTNKPSNLRKHRVTTTIQPSNHPTIQPYPKTGLLNLIQQLGRLRPFVARALQCRTIRMEFHQLSHQLHRRLPAAICWVWWNQSSGREANGWWPVVIFHHGLVSRKWRYQETITWPGRFLVSPSPHLLSAVHQPKGCPWHAGSILHSSNS